jgi:hypothetical protein
MYVEYLPPQADVLLEKEASTDCYIIVSGAVVSRVFFVPCSVSTL